MTDPGFERSVFINCPFDKDYDFILQAIAFCVIFLGFSPRLALESSDSAVVRLDKIKGLIEDCKFSIHDLSRCESTKKGERFRLNMPFELGVDFGCREYMRGRESKRFLILEEKPYRYQAALSDISGCDIKAHANDFQKAISCVRNWLVSEAEVSAAGLAAILTAYMNFQEWNYERQIEDGFSDDDIQSYQTVELLRAMKTWMARGRPI